VVTFTNLKLYFLGKELLIPTRQEAKVGFSGGVEDMEKRKF
jgi:hypothetical protein